MLAAAMLADYGMTIDEFFAAEPSLVNALFAASCERAGMKGAETYRAKDILAQAPFLMAQSGDVALMQ